MNICLVSLVTVWHGVKGGMEIHGKLLTEGLVGLGHEVTILSSRQPSGAQVAATAGLNHYALAHTRFGSQRGGWASECFRAFGELHSRRPFDVVCSQQAVLPGRMLRLCRRAGVPVVALMEGHEGLMLVSEVRQSLSHGTGYARLPRRALASAYHYVRWELPLMRAADRIIAVSDEIARSLGHWFGVARERIEVVHNGVDTGRFRPDSERGASIRRALGLGEDEAMVLFLSHVTRQKGLHVLLRALTGVRATWPRVRVVVVGAGDYFADGQALAQRLGVSSQVLFVGEVDHERAPEYLAACDVFTLPTLRQEGLPFALLEAMACQKPVLASRIGGVPSVIRDGVNGVLVPAGDSEALAKGLLSLLADRQLAGRLARSARDTVLRAFSAEHMVRGTADVFERVVKARRAP